MSVIGRDVMERGALLGAGRPPALERSGRACLTLTCRLGRQHPVTTGLRQSDQQQLCQKRSRQAGQGSAAAVQSQPSADFQLHICMISSWSQSAALCLAQVAISLLHL